MGTWKWELDDAGHLLISGTEVSIAGDKECNSPWAAFASDVKSASFAPGTTAAVSISTMFSTHSNMTSVDFTNLSLGNVTDISKLLSGCSSLTSDSITFGRISTPRT